MQQFKSKMTRLKNLINRFPDSGDIFGYQGVTKNVLLTALDTAYNLAQGIDDSDADNQLIIISLKRMSSAFYNKYKNILESETDLPARDNFGEFIDGLSELIEKTKSVYFICNSGSERAAGELMALKGDVEEFKKFKATYSQEFESAKSEVAEMRELHQEVTTLSEGVRKSHDESQAANDKVQSLKEAVEENAENAGEWKDEIEQCRTDIEGMRNDFSKIKGDIGKVSQDAQKVKEQSDAYLQEIGANLAQSKKLLDESQLTLASSNRYSMAASFEDRKKELLKPMRLWGAALVVALICIACVIIWGPKVDFAGATAFSWIGPILFRTALIAPCIWLGWYSGKQYGYTVRVREDYSFKYACAVAYEGFKKAADGEDSRLGEILLELCMLNMSQQPLRVYAQSKFGVKGLPVEELLEAVKGKLPHLDSLELKHGNTTLRARLANEGADGDDDSDEDDEQEEDL